MNKRAWISLISLGLMIWVLMLTYHLMIAIAIAINFPIRDMVAIYWLLVIIGAIEWYLTNWNDD